MLADKNVMLSDLVDSLPKTWQSPTLGRYCPDDVKYGVVVDIKNQKEQDLRDGRLIGGKKIRELITVNGVRFRLEDNSWGLIRASSNKASLVVVVESRTAQTHTHDIYE